MRTLIIIIALIVLVLGLGFFFFGDTPTAEAPTTTETETMPDPATEEETTPASSDENDDESSGANVEGGTDVGAEFPVLDSEDDASAPYDALVTYTNDGFTPETVTIQAGETVRFVNESSRDMWVGSDNHPTHTLYPESSTDDCLGSSFDQCEGVVAGAFFEFTFTEGGTWGYHNHVRSSHGGVVIVE